MVVDIVLTINFSTIITPTITIITSTTTIAIPTVATTATTTIITTSFNYNSDYSSLAIKY